jgi:hypothetical protein
MAGAPSPSVTVREPVAGETYALRRAVPFAPLGAGIVSRTVAVVRAADGGGDVVAAEIGATGAAPPEHPAKNGAVAAAAATTNQARADRLRPFTSIS